MDIAVDSNILIYASLEDFPEHRRAVQALQGLARRRDDRMVLSLGILHELMHIVTDKRRLPKALPVASAVQLVRSYLGRSNVLVLAPDELDLEASLTLMLTHQLGQMRMADTLLASTLRRHGVVRLWTTNPRDFQIFDFLQVENPCSTQG